MTENLRRLPRPSWSRRRSWPRSARWRRQWHTGSGTRSRASGQRRRSSASTRRRPRPPSTSMPSSRRWTGWTAASVTCSASRRPAPFHPMPESVPRLVEGSAAGIRRAAAGAPGGAAARLPARLPDVRVDPMQLEQALVEIVSNALDAMPAGGRLRIGAVSNGGARPGAGGDRDLRHRCRHSRARAAFGLRAVLHHAAGGHRAGARHRQALRGAERRAARDREPAGRARRCGCVCLPPPDATVADERLDRAHRGRRAHAGPGGQGVPDRSGVRGRSRGRCGAGARAARDTAAGRGFCRRASPGHERHRPAPPHPRVRSRAFRSSS